MGIMVDAINAKMPGRYSEKDKEMLIKAAEYHDIGKITVPVSVLDKNGRPTPEEFSVIQMHPVNGSDIIWSWLGNSDLSKEDADVIYNFVPHNASIVIENGEVTRVNRRYTP
jgi:HD-GYP domain-containing protein (c-di-GMP phosphodiesterase class II)